MDRGRAKSEQPGIIMSGEQLIRRLLKLLDFHLFEINAIFKHIELYFLLFVYKNSVLQLLNLQLFLSASICSILTSIAKK